MAVTSEVVPYGPEATATLRRAIDDAQGADRLAPVTVVVSRGAVGLDLRRQLARPAGLGNVRFVTLARLADQLGSGVLGATGRLPATPAVVAAAARSALAGRPGSLLWPVRDHPATVRALVSAARDLRHAPPATLARLAAQGPRPAEVVALVAEVRRRLDPGWYDEVDLVEAARGAVAKDPTRAIDLGPVVVHLPGAVAPAHERLLRQLATAVPVHVVVGLCGDPGADADAQATVERWSPSVPSGASRPVPRPTASSVVSAPAADAEVLTAVRGLVDRQARGTPLERMAVVWGGPGPYPRLVREALTQAGIPHNGSGLRPLSATVAGRTLLGAFTVVEGGFRRDDLVAWISGAPVRHRGRPVPATEWDLVSREAGVVEGLAEWSRRLGELGRRSPPEAPTPGVAADLETFVSDLAERFAGPRTTWADWARWARSLLEDCLGRPAERAGWPIDEEQALEAAGDGLAGLSVLDRLDLRPTPATFRSVLDAELSSPAPQTSRFGRGVFTGRVGELAGLSLDVVWVVGMHDGAFPARLVDDPLLSDGERAAADPDLPRRAERSLDQRRQYLAGLAAAPERVVSFARGDQADGRQQRPSAWLLESLAALATGAGAPVTRLYSRDVPALAPRPGFVHLPSYWAAATAAGPPVSLADRDRRQLMDWRAQHRGIAGHPLVDHESVLARGVATRRQRRSSRFTRFDGLVDTVAVPSPSRGAAQSPTGLQAYATCPRRYLLGRILGMGVRPRPEALERIEPVERGNVVHQVLQRFFAAQVARPAPERIQPGERWTAADRDHLLAVADEVFAEFEGRGLTGRPVLWGLDRAAIRRDLVRFLVEDDDFRARHGVVPEAVEVAFGYAERPPVPVELPGGATVSFRGSVDRVDRSPAGDRVVVVDYKTGRVGDHRDLVADPVARGTKLQLPVYGLAARDRWAAPAVHATYWFVTDREDFTAIGYDLDQDHLDRFTEVLGTLVAGIEAGNFPARPGEERWPDFANCRYCDFVHLCPTDKGHAWEQVRHDRRLAGYVALAEPAAGGGG